MVTVPSAGFVGSMQWMRQPMGYSWLNLGSPRGRKVRSGGRGYAMLYKPQYPTGRMKLQYGHRASTFCAQF